MHTFITKQMDANILIYKFNIKTKIFAKISYLFLSLFLKTSFILMTTKTDNIIALMSCLSAESLIAGHIKR